jgi:ribonuclease HI
MAQTQQLKILQWNCRSASANRDDILLLIKEHKPDIVALCETWYTQNSFVSFPGFSCHRHDRLDGRWGGGTAILIKNSLPYKEIHIAPPSNVQLSAVNLGDISIISAYIPPRNPFDETFWKNAFSKLGKTYVILADFNAHGMPWGCVSTDSAGRGIIDVTDELNLCILNYGCATRFAPPHQSQNALDISICTGDIASLTSWRVLDDTMSSDHYPILIDINNKSQHVRPQMKRKRFCTRFVDWSRFSSNITNSIETISPLQHDPEACATQIYDIFNKSAKDTVPRTFSMATNGKFPPWWDDECDEMVKKRARALKKYKKNFTPDNYLEVRRVQALTKKLLRKKKRQGWYNYCKSLSPDTNISEIWQSIRQFRGVYTPKSDPWKYYSSWIAGFVGRLAPDYVPNMSEIHKEKSCNTEDSHVLTSPFTLDELKSAINCSNDSTPGPDNVPYTFFKHSPEKFLPFILNLFNSVMESGNIPSEWKSQLIIPIPKPGKSPFLESSYRPIALSSCFLKLLERMLKCRLEWFLERDDAIPEWQCGFRRGRSCIDNIAMLVSDIMLAKTNGKAVIACFMDVQSAFDNVLLPMLFTKMLRVGVPERICSLIFNIMSERKIIVDTPDGSIFRNVYKGLPQGSVLSPILFNIYTFDIGETIPPECSIIQYADDFVVYCAEKVISKAAAKLNETMNCINEWIIKNGFSLSPSKSQIVVFTNKHRVPPTSISIDREEIPVKESIRFLGIVLQRKLSWNMNIDSIIAKCEKNLNIIKAVSRVWWGAHPSTLKTLYIALIRSHLEYGAFLMEPLPHYLSLKLDRVQAKCLRIILGAMRSSPLIALQAECVEMPLFLRRKSSAHRFLIKKMNQCNHPIFQKINSLSQRYTDSPKYTNKLPPLLCNSLELINEKFQSCFAHSLPIYSIPFDSLMFSSSIIPSINLDKNHSSLSPKHVNKIFQNEVSNRWPRSILFYTDGSKSSDGGCGAAFFSPTSNIHQKFQLPQICSVFTAESLAMREALREAIKLTSSDVVIFTDSLSLVNALQSNFNAHANNYLICDIKKLLFIANSKEITVSIVWIPSHIGISGNEKVDLLAKEACSCGILPPYFAPTIDDCINFSENTLRAEWNAAFAASPLGSNYKQIQPTIPSKPWYHGMKLSKLTISLISRLRLGHCIIASHLARINILFSSMCECEEEEETANHIFFNCSLLPNDDFLQDILAQGINLPVSVNYLLAQNDKKITSFLAKHLIKNKKMI